jgi:hypothetical protein
MVYTIEKGIINTKTWFKRLAIGLTALAMPVGLVASVGGASAATTYTLTPWTYVGAAGDCGTDYPAGTPGGVVSKWDNTTGNPSPSLLLEKNVPTTDCSSAGATINGVEGITLTELNFDYKTGTYCGAGAPRFNVEASDGSHFMGGCSNGTQTDLGNGWTHVVIDPTNPAQAFPVMAPDATVNSIDIVFDEQGSTNIDNISVNDQEIGGPNTPTSKQDCKNGGWMNLTDAQGNPFENQGQCVAYVNGGGTHVHNLTKVNNNNNVGVLNFNGQSANSGRAVVKNNTTGGNAASGSAGNSNSSNFNIVVSNF